MHPGGGFLFSEQGKRRPAGSCKPQPCWFLSPSFFLPQIIQELFERSVASVFSGLA
jgi:hypothetical protein